jgi:hypothetical protein
MNSTNTINPKPCSYNCGTRIYWNVSDNAYFEVFSKKKHICPNRSKSSTTTLYYYMKNVYYIMIYAIKSERSKKSKWNKYLYYFKLCILRKGNECICKQQCY